MMGSKKCRVVRAYGTYCKGDVIWPPGALRDELLAGGFIEIVPDAAPAESKGIETSEPARETAQRKRRDNRQEAARPWDR